MWKSEQKILTNPIQSGNFCIELNLKKKSFIFQIHSLKLAYSIKYNFPSTPMWWRTHTYVLYIKYCSLSRNEHTIHMSYGRMRNIYGCAHVSVTESTSVCMHNVYTQTQSRCVYVGYTYENMYFCTVCVDYLHCQFHQNIMDNWMCTINRNFTAQNSFARFGQWFTSKIRHINLENR